MFFAKPKQMQCPVLLEYKTPSIRYEQMRIKGRILQKLDWLASVGLGDDFYRRCCLLQRIYLFSVKNLDSYEIIWEPVIYFFKLSPIRDFFSRPKMTRHFLIATFCLTFNEFLHILLFFTVKFQENQKRISCSSIVYESKALPSELELSATDCTQLLHLLQMIPNSHKKFIVSILFRKRNLSKHIHDIA